MSKKGMVYIPIILSFIFSFNMLDKSVSRFFAILLALVFIVWVLISGLEIAGIMEWLGVLGCPPLLTVLTGILSKYGIDKYISSFYEGILSNFCGWNYVLDEEVSVLITLWVIFLGVYYLRYKKDSTVLKKLKGSEDREFREKNYAEKCEKFCKALGQRIEGINSENDWNEELFTPIDAEVEVCIGEKQKKKYDDLLKCLKSIKHKGAIFLVLGEPGAGKSVALRKLCLELLRESKKTKKVPVYINLKKWNKNWNLDNIPDKKDLVEFIRSILYEKGDILTDEFLDTYFHKMLEEGRWYFIFDSFDEMPCLMGKKNCQELIDKISELLYHFMSDTNQSGGIIASRLFKSPSEAIGATVTLKIQAFSDIKIKLMIKKYLNNADEVVKELFGKREELVVLCRNPFYLSLLLSYLRERDVQFPENQMELYQSFVNGRLKRCAGKLESEKITAEEVHEAAKELAAFMHDSEIYGLECPISELLSNGDEYNWVKAIKMLEYAKLCRYGGQEGTVSFVHRRFQEFFMVEKIIESGIAIGVTNYEGIVDNSHMRDALVLYCEVADEKNAREIAEFCWGVVKENISYSESILKKESIKLVNTLYFMTEAFRNRKQAISGFVREYEGLVEQYLDKKTDFVVRYALAESMVLFEEEYLQKVVHKVFELKNRWLSDIVMQNNRIISELDVEVERKFINYLGQIDKYTFWKRFRNVDFSLSLSKEFGRIRIIHFLMLLIDISNVIAIGLLGINLLINLKKYLLIIGGMWESGTVNFNSSRAIDYNVEGNELLLFIICFISSFFISNILIILSKRKESIFCAFFLLLILTLVYNQSVAMWLVIILSIPTVSMLLVLLYHKIHHIRISGIKTVMPQTETVVSASIIVVFFVGIALVPPEIVQYIMVALLFVFALLLVSIIGGGIVYLINYIKDRQFVLRQPSLKVISRTRVEENLSKIHRQRWKKQYISNLLYNKVELTGEWSSDSRALYDDELEFMLAKLECTKNDSLSYWF